MSAVLRLAAFLYRQTLRLATRVMPPDARGEMGFVFDRLQRDAYHQGGVRGLAGYWLREFGTLARVLISPPHLPIQAAGADHGRGRAMALRYDVRDGWRALRHAPAYTAVAVLMLALGIGMNTALFSVADALLFRTLPYPDADRLVMAAEWPRAGGNWTVAPTAFMYWREHTQSYAQLEARIGQAYALVGNGDPEDVRGLRVTPGYFDLLGMKPSAGRTFTAADAAPGQPCVVVMSHRLWSRRLGGDPSSLGQPLRLSGQTCALIGVLPEGSVFDRVPADLYTPLVVSPAERASDGRMLTVIGRLRPGITVDRAAAELSALMVPFNAARGPAGRNWSAAVWKWSDVLIRPDARRLVSILFGAVALVLLIACVNVAGLSLSRALVRRRELAVRVALGAGRARLFRAMLIESLMLGALGGGLGILVATWALGAFVALVPAGTFPAEIAPALDLRGLLFTFSAALAAGALAGALPGWQAGRLPLAQTLAAGGRSGSGSRRASTLQSLLLVVEIAIAMVLVVGATLLTASFMKLSSVKPGFDPANVLTFSLTAPPGRYATDAQLADFYARVRDALGRAPSVHAVGAATSLPLGGWLYGTGVSIEGVAANPDRPASAHLQITTPGYFDALRIPVAAGRGFTERDDARAAPVAVVNETFVSRFVPDGRAVGGRVHLGPQQPGGPDPPIEIIGVIRNVKTGGLADADLATPEIYVPHAQAPISPMVFAVRGAPGMDAALQRDARAAVCAVDCQVPLTNALPMDERIGLSLRIQRFRTVMIAAFAGLAVLLACLGVYAIRARAVEARAREMGIRIALGADTWGVLRLALLQGLRLAGIGLAAGIAASWVLAGAIGPWLFDTRATDPLIVLLAVGVLGAATLIASWIPARRASRVDPLVVLRQD